MKHTYVIEAHYNNGSTYHCHVDLKEGLTREEEEEAITSTLPRHVQDALDNVTYHMLRRKN